MLGDPFDDMPQIGLWIEPVKFRRADQAVDRGGSLAAGVGAGEEIIFSAQGHRTQPFAPTNWIIRFNPRFPHPQECWRCRLHFHVAGLNL
jgi:hypothetical protein